MESGKGERRKRYRLLDALRGMAVISMILYHMVWDLVHIYGADIKWITPQGDYIWQQATCWTFILLSGICWNLGRKKVQRGAVVLLMGAVVSAVTIVFTPQSRIIFGILTFLGSAMILMIPMDRVVKKIPGEWGVLLSFLLFMGTRKVQNGYVGFGSFVLFEIPQSFPQNILTAFIGFRHDDFFSTDYFPLLPWIFLFVCGYFIYKVMKKYEVMENVLYLQVPMFSKLGEKSLIIYMLHQPVIYILLYVAVL